MKVLVTGWRGFIGKNVTEYLESKGCEIIKFGGDLTDFANITQSFSENPDAVVHLAAYGNDSSHDQILPQGTAKTLETNVVGTSLLISEFIKSSARTFINIGSSSEYGTQRTPLSIKTPLEGITPYARSKAAVSTLLDGLHVDGKYFRTLRLFSVFGPYEKENRLIPTVFRSAVTGQTMPLSSGVHDFIHVKDVCRSILHLLEMPEICPSITHAASGVQYTNQEVVELVEKVTSRVVSTRPVDKMRTFDTTNKWVSDTRSLLLDPIYTFQEGLEATWQWIQNN